MSLIHSVLRDTRGVLVDVGAHLGSSMRVFVRDGWRVYAFEPEPAIRALLLADPMTDSPLVTIDPRAVAEQDDEMLTLYTSPLSTGISTLTPFHPSHRPAAKVRTVRLDTYLADVEVVTALKTDVEGHDLPVLRTFPWQRLRPKAVVCEFEDRKTAPLGYGHADMTDFLRDHGYAVFVSEWYPIVQYGSVHRWRSFGEAHGGLADENAWGNIVAVDPELKASLMKTAKRAATRLGVGLALRRVRASLRRRED